MSDTLVKERKHAAHHAKHARRRLRHLGAGKEVKVTVIATPGTGVDPIDFSFDSTLKKGGHLVFNKSDNGMKKSDYYLIEFDLDDRTALGLRFDPNPMDAFWVEMGDEDDPPPCPTIPTYSAQIYAICDDPKGRTLTVRNDDDIKQYFAYSLGFVDQDGAPHRYDPVGQNQNGGSTTRLG